MASTKGLFLDKHRKDSLAALPSSNMQPLEKTNVNDKDFVMINGMPNNGRRSSLDLQNYELNVVLSQNKEESKKEDEKKQELNDDNIWKQRSVKIRRDYLCRTSSTLVVTPVDGRLLKSSSSVLKLVGGNGKHLQHHLMSCTNKKTKMKKKIKKKQLNNKKEENMKWKIQISTALHGIQAEKVERFKGLTVAKVLFGTSNDVKKALGDKEIRIGYRLLNCELFDKYRSTFHSMQEKIVILKKEKRQEKKNEKQKGKKEIEVANQKKPAKEQKETVSVKKNEEEHQRLRSTSPRNRSRNRLRKRNDN
ncbi:hypothetical protein RFI_00142 [Reticulomyxa filosa]|uniref:Uncharacterized protein n=1 Tax=Reticulomyxa filosa TaxID=46433 RepID=X6PEL5_RETFI|nr:hypothetical protein RFI_00142 [Reticulomyxa filosa]|eukprot:ETO36920.1 hypothetical protein RFI_00142 [Reticulomyxa filosa]